MNLRTTPITSTVVARVLVLAYGGVALAQWVHSHLLGGESAGYGEWLRGATLALPFIAAAVLLGSRRGAGNNTFGVASLFSVVMGAGVMLRHLFPQSAQGGHAHDSPVTSLSLLLHVAAIMLASGAYALLVDKVLAALDGADQPLPMRLPFSPRLVRVAVPALLIMVVLPMLFFKGEGRAIAQTSFPDQVIHPKGSLLLVARRLQDGSMAYVAPDFGANGVRPTIEMTEGEVLNITLKNETDKEVSLHVHGVHYKQDSDGTRHSNSFARPGQQYNYQWTAAPGTAGYWHYHDHVLGDDEGSIGILNGLYGGLIVRKAGDTVKPSKTFVIVGHDRTLNGRIYPETPTYTARQGELVEWLIISHGSRVHTFHLHAHRWLTPPRPGDPNPASPGAIGSGKEDNRILSPGDSFGFIVIAGDGVGPGMWMYHCHFQDHAAAMKGFFKVTPPSGGSVIEPATVQTARTFPETGKTVSGRFLEYWNANGGLAQQGFPISDEFMEKSDLDGKTYKVQYFERAVFEHHPENKPPHDVLLSQLGTFRYKQKYPNGR